MPNERSLKDHMKAAVGAMPGASMVPDYNAPPREKHETKEPEVVPDAREVIESDLDRNLLARLCAQHVEWNQAEKVARDAKKPITAKIKEILARNKATKLMVGDIRASYYNAPRSSLSRDLLLANGVTPAVIAKSTVTKDAYSLRLTLAGETEEDEE